MLERKKLYVFTKDLIIDDDDSSITFKQGECVMLTGVYTIKLVTCHGTHVVDASQQLEVEEACKLVPDQLPIGSVVKVVRYSDRGGSRWPDAWMGGTLDKVGTVLSVGLIAGNTEPWYKVRIGGGTWYYDRDSLELAELGDDERICDDCGRIVDLSDTYTTADDRVICSDCYDDSYETCDECGMIYHTEDISDIDDRQICDGCRENYYSECPQCGELFRTEDGIEDEDDTSVVYCSEHCLNEATGGKYFHDYGYKPSPNFHKCPDETDVPGYYGIELELELNGADRASTAKDITLTGDDFVYCKHDGSLSDGIETVSHPATYAYHMTDIWKKVIDTAVDAGMSAEATCGLHVHASRTFFGTTQLGQELTIAKVLYCFERLWDSIVVFSRRENVSHIEDWACKSATGIKGTDDTSTVRNKLRKNGPQSRYSAVNLCNSNTVEFRIFASTTDVAELQGSIGFVHTLIQYCNSHTVKQCQMLTWDNLTKYAHKRSPEFFMLSKKLIKAGK